MDRQQPRKACKRKIAFKPNLPKKPKGMCMPKCECEIDAKDLVGSDLTADHNPSYMTGPNVVPDNLDFLCDITIRSNGGQEYRAHKVFLMALGQKFEEMYLDESKPNDIITLDVSNEVLKQVYGYVYHNGEYAIDEDNIWGLGKFAKEFGTKGIQKTLGDHVTSNIEPRNALQMQAIAETLLCPKVAGMTRLFIIQNFKEINRLTNDMFGAVPIADLESMLEDDNLNITEEELFTAMVKWAGNDTTRQTAIITILGLVRFTLMSAEFFEREVMTSDIAKNPASSKTLDGARSYFYHLARPKRKCSMTGRRAMKREPYRVPNEVILTSGGWITLPGNPIESGPQGGFQAYNIRSRIWGSQNASLPWARRCLKWAYHGMVEMDKKIYMFGGFNGHNHVRSLVCLDIISGISHNLALMNDRRCYVSGTKCGGKIYACGGARLVRQPTGEQEIQRLNSAEVYDPQSNEWNLLPDMRRIRSDASAVTLNGKVYILGGFDGAEILNSIEIYDPSTNEWTYGPPMQSRRSGLKAVVIGANIFAVGGYDGNDRLSTVECLDTKRMQPRWENVAPMLSQRSNFAIAAIENQIRVIGGYRPGGVFAECENYCPRNNLWTMCPSLDRGQSATAAVTISDLPMNHALRL